MQRWRCCWGRAYKRWQEASVERQATLTPPNADSSMTHAIVGAGRTHSQAGANQLQGVDGKLRKVGSAASQSAVDCSVCPKAAH